MEIPGIKNKAIQNKIKVGNKPPVEKNDKGSTSGSSSTQGTDTTSFTSDAKAIQSAVNSIKNNPETVRIDKVRELQNSIKNGYRIDSHDLAEKLLKDMIKESQFLG